MQNSDAGVVKQAVSALSTCVSDSSECCDQAVSCGTVPSLLHLLQHNDGCVAEHATTVLGCLTRYDAEKGVFFSSAGGVATLLELLQHDRTEVTACAPIQALSLRSMNLTESRPFYLQGAK